MNKNALIVAVEAYRQRSVKLWLLLSGMVFSIVIFFLVYRTIVLVKAYKQSLLTSATLNNDIQALKELWGSHQRLSRIRKNLKKECAFFERPDFESHLTYIAQNLGPESYLTEITFCDGCWTLKGCAPNQGELHSYQKSLEQTHSAKIVHNSEQAPGNLFEIEWAQTKFAPIK
jgi:hypothetical protein